MQTGVEHMQVTLQCRDAREQPHEQSKDDDNVSWCDPEAPFAEHKYCSKQDKREELEQSPHHHRQNGCQRVRSFKPPNDSIDLYSGEMFACSCFDNLDAGNL